MEQSYSPLNYLFKSSQGQQQAEFIIIFWLSFMEEICDVSSSYF